MKIYTLAIALFLLLFIGACKKDSASGPQTLSGKWKLAGNYISAGGPMYYTPASDKSLFTIFNADGTLSGTAFGTFKHYTIKDSINVTLTEDNAANYENYRYVIRHDSLFMSPAGPNICIEGCSTVLVR